MLRKQRLLRRRQMRLSLLHKSNMLAGALFMATAAMAGAPDFSERIYGDGVAWGTKGLNVLPAPNEHNRQSFDPLFVITNSNNPEGQLPVSEAAPGNPAYNGGRWFTHTVEWTSEGFQYHGIVPVLTSYSDIQEHPGPRPPGYDPGLVSGRPAGLLRVSVTAGEINVESWQASQPAG
jgi:hypothetical protein